MKEKISGEEYKRIYVPVGPWVLVEKDVLPEKTAGGIILPDQGRENHTRITSTGTIVALSPFKAFENQWDAYLHSSFKVGDQIGFSDTTPVLSPSPPDMEFAESCNQRFVTMHISDILMVFCDTEEKKKEFEGRM